MQSGFQDIVILVGGSLEFFWLEIELWLSKCPMSQGILVLSLSLSLTVLCPESCISAALRKRNIGLDDVIGVFIWCSVGDNY